jgi:tetratricopeptide (TPR) repeat protein
MIPFWQKIPKFSRFTILILGAIGAVLLSRLLAPDHQVEVGQASDYFPKTAQRAATSAQGAIEGLQESLRADPEDWQAYGQLGLAYLQQARETGDPAYYPKAEAALQAAMDRQPDDYLSLGGMGMLALARHQFGEALEWGGRARQRKPDSAFAYGILADAQVELGMIDAAAASLQTMVDLRPDLSAYSRISYLRELHGDIEGALLMMQWAVDAGSPKGENTAWTRVQLGNLYFNTGQLEKAEEQYALTLGLHPGYAYALAGLGRVAAARGDFEAACEYLEQASQAIPVPEFIISLQELYEKTGDSEAAMEKTKLLGAIQQLYEASGVDMDLEIALFNADRRIDLERTLENTRQAYARRPSVYGSDVLAWVLYQTGRLDEARDYSRKALSLGSRQALFLFHAGMIEYGLGNLAEASRYLEDALETNPYFSVRYAPEARAIMEEISTID